MAAMRNGRNPTRRNRNIGTAKQGHGQNNRDRIPRLWRDSVIEWSRSRPHTVVLRHVWGRTMPFLVEHTLSDCYHACTVNDISTLLGMLPKRHVNSYKDIKGIQGVVLRQPTRKEMVLGPVWGRLGYAVDVGGIFGPAIFIEAQHLPVVVHWGKHLNPDEERELEHLRGAAASSVRTPRGHDLTFDLEAVRRVQLFQTVPHEVGHWADMYEHVERPALDDLQKWNALWDRYFQRPVSQRETSAHRYAEQAVEHLREAGSVPYARKLDIETLRADGLRLEDFIPETTCEESNSDDP